MPGKLQIPISKLQGSSKVQGAQQCEQVEKEFAEAAAPDTETLLKLLRVLILQLSTQASADPELIKLVNQSMRTVLEHARHEKRVALQERRTVVLEEKFKLVKEEEARLEAELSKEKPVGLRPETIAKIREELNWM